MKKLMVMLGAVAMSFGLFADATPFSISFETAESAKGVNTTDMEFDAKNANGWTWAGDPLALKEYNGDKYGYTTTARRDDEFDGQTDNDNYLTLSTGSDELVRAMGANNVFVDQLVKFTGFEDVQTNLVGGTKIAVWMSGIENDTGVTGETNLYVTVGKVALDGSVEQVALKIANPVPTAVWETEKWYRLTIKSIGDIYGDAATIDTARAGFIVYIDGVQVASSDEAAKTLIAATSELTAKAAGYMAKGQLFPAIDATDAVFTSVGFKGIGAIDDIVIDAEGPEFAKEVEVSYLLPANVIIDKVMVGDDEIPGIGGKYTVAKGSDVTVYLKGAEDYYLIDPTYYESFDVQSSEPIDLTEEITVTEAVAEIDGEFFETLDEALDEAENQAETDDDVIVTIRKECATTDGSCAFAGAGSIEITDNNAAWLIEGNVTLVGVEVETEVTEGTLTLSGAVTANVKAEVIEVPDAATITLAVDAEIATKTDIKAKIADQAGYTLEKKENTPSDGWTTYWFKEIPTTFEVTVNAAEAGSTIKSLVIDGVDQTAAPGKYDVSEKLTVTYTLADGYKWADKTTADKSFEATAADTITAPETAKIFTITPTDGANAAVTLNPTDGKGIAGDTVEITAKANETFTYEGVETTGWDYDTATETITKTVTIEADAQIKVPDAVAKVAPDPVDGKVDENGQKALDALKDALPDDTDINAYAADVYGGNIPAEKLNKTTESLAALAAEAKLKIMASPVTLTTAKGTADKSFTFTLSDADGANPLVAATLAQKLVQYTDDLGTTEFAPSNAKAVTVALEEATPPTYFTATLTGNDAEGEAATAGFMKVEIK